ncbi:MAG: hypothetical protein LBO79_00470 [Zoogloeaceae bacterium]|jgi:hypothetical protein|nr:hypothetical protein [Zoogloeaceae bacterium]
MNHAANRSLMIARRLIAARKTYAECVFTHSHITSLTRVCQPLPVAPAAVDFSCAKRGADLGMADSLDARRGWTLLVEAERRRVMMPIVSVGWDVLAFVLCLVGFFFLVFANEREGRRLLHRPAS